MWLGLVREALDEKLSNIKFIKGTGAWEGQESKAVRKESEAAGQGEGVRP